LKSVTQQYAAALADVALEKRQTEPLKRELGAFVELLNQSFELRNFLATPAVEREAKQAVIEKLVARLGASRELRNFLFIIVENRRSALLPEIAKEFEAELLDRLGVARAEITSARELTEQQKTDLGNTLEGLTGKRIEPRYAVDPELVGGVMVRIASTIYDGSVRSQLVRLETILATE
jgi:F-type H+-transporting ATPase subunit delta